MNAKVSYASENICSEFAGRKQECSENRNNDKIISDLNTNPASATILATKQTFQVPFAHFLLHFSCHFHVQFLEELRTNSNQNRQIC